MNSTLHVSTRKWLTRSSYPVGVICLVQYRTPTFHLYLCTCYRMLDFYQHLSHPDIIEPVIRQVFASHAASDLKAKMCPMVLILCRSVFQAGRHGKGYRTRKIDETDCTENVKLEGGLEGCQVRMLLEASLRVFGFQFVTYTTSASMHHVHYSLKLCFMWHCI